MPELPEVQTVLDTLHHQIQDLVITDVTVFYPKMMMEHIKQKWKAWIYANGR